MSSNASFRDDNDEYGHYDNHRRAPPPPPSRSATTYSQSLYAPEPTHPGPGFLRDRSPSPSPIPTPSPFYDEQYTQHNDPYQLHNDRLGATNPYYHDNAPSVSSYDDNRNPFESDDAIPLRPQYDKNQSQLYAQPYGGYEGTQPLTTESTEPARDITRRKRGRRFFSWNTPWFIYTLTLVQISVFIAEIAKNASLTGSPIEIHPQFNPMIGPSPYVMINMGARYVPCMRNTAGVQNASQPLYFPCPNTTSTTSSCSLSELCGFSGVPALQVNGSLDQKPAPNQWYRFIIPIFLHAGIIHIGFNMLLQIMLGAEMERAIGAIRVALVYFPSGIFGFIMGGNFAPSGLASTGASGSLFGIIALLLLDLFYTWSDRPSPWRDLMFLLIDSIISFVLGLLPGVDNFSHIGGFIMGIIIGLCLLRSPNSLRKRLGDDYTPTSQSANPAPKEYKMVYSDVTTSKEFFTSPRNFFLNRKGFWWAWWLVRAGALVAAIILFIVLLNNFYTHYATTCSWCKYLSCLPVKNWCDIGDLTFQQQPTTTTNPNLLFSKF